MDGEFNREMNEDERGCSSGRWKTLEEQIELFGKAVYATEVKGRQEKAKEKAQKEVL